MRADELYDQNARARPEGRDLDLNSEKIYVI